MNFTFLFPLIAAIILLLFSLLVIRAYIKTRLITLLILEVLPLTFGIWMINRTISALSTGYIDLFRFSNVLYIIGPIFLVIFVDLVTNGKISWKSVLFAFCGGALTIGALFVDDYTVGYNPNSGWVQITLKNPLFYIFLYTFNFIIFLFVFGLSLIQSYVKNTGKNKMILKQIIIVFFLSVLGTFIFSALRIVRLIDYPVINSLDALFIAFGFGYLSWQYLKHPYVFHLDLLDVQLYGLFVYDLNGIMLYNYDFQSKFDKQRDLITTAFSGINTLFKEILASDQPLKEVRQGENIVLFESSKDITIGLVLNLSTIMTRNWLYQFRVKFEKNFKNELELYFNTSEISFYNKPDELVKEIFFFD